MALILDNFARRHRLAHIDTGQKKRWQKDLKVPYSVFRIPGSRISDSGSRLEPEGESPGRPDSDCGNGVTGA